MFQSAVSLLNRQAIAARVDEGRDLHEPGNLWVGLPHGVGDVVDRVPERRDVPERHRGAPARR